MTRTLREWFAEVNASDLMLEQYTLSNIHTGGIPSGGGGGGSLEITIITQDNKWAQ